MGRAGTAGHGRRMAPPHSSSLRIGRWSCPECIYLVTFTTFRRRAYFREWDNAREVARTLSGPEAWADSSLLCWVLMPDHWHGVLRLGRTDTLSRNVGRAKALAARRWNGGVPLWAKGFHDSALRSSEALLAAAHYVVSNPLEAGLATSPGSYPFWDIRSPELATFITDCG